ncbi:MAG: phosphatidylserine/phosphatidylglycerophosphate/cardiolipin synthase [Rhodocyclales bacterium]|nr:phosphatidylserine/phosphatidylglycerophosphate/cardiolipin synthase [Rhodocyclales bacterium]
MSPLLPGNHITLLQNGTEFFPALLEAIAEAQHDIQLETYIFEPDATGRRVSAALCEAARRGVHVRVVADGFGSRAFIAQLQPALTNAGAEVLVFRKDLGLFALQRRRLRRMHRKLTVVDGRIAFVGGINIIDDSNTPHQIPPRFDYAIRIEGPLVRQVRAAQEELWRILCWANFHRRPRPPADVATTIAAAEPAGKIRAAFVMRDNLRHRKDIENAYLAAIGRARREIIIANAYFLPGRRFRSALLHARERGVSVTLLLQGRIEYWLLHHACQAIYPHLLSAGIHIVEYRKSFLHAKVAVIDKDWATVGSSNIDPFSLMLAREANVIVRDINFTNELRTSLLAAMHDGGIELAADNWQKRPWRLRLLSWAAFGVVRMLTGRLVRHGE